MDNIITATLFSIFVGLGLVIYFAVERANAHTSAIEQHCTEVPNLYTDDYTKSGSQLRPVYRCINYPKDN
jgi:hypothetical protein